MWHLLKLFMIEGTISKLKHKNQNIGVFSNNLTTDIIFLHNYC